MHNSKINEHLCRVCGLYQEESPWGADGNTPTFNICDCCGVEFGYEDATPQAAEKFRCAWLASGAQWFDKTKKPMDWKLSAQLAHIGLDDSHPPSSC